MTKPFIVVCTLFLLCSSVSHTRAEIESSLPSEKKTVNVEFGANVPSAVPLAVTRLLEAVGVTVVTGESEHYETLACGDTPLFTMGKELATLGQEAYIVQATKTSEGHRAVAANGNAPQPLRRDPHYSDIAGRAAAFGCYAALEAMGFGFLHPLAPSLPSSVDLTMVETIVKPAPRWRLRGWHVHTEHPIELNDLLTGFDVTINGTVLETWESMLPDWEKLLQWCLAQGLNRVEWLPLMAKDWEEYAFSKERQLRFLNLTNTARSYGLHAGVDAAIAEVQQHGMTLVNSSADHADAPATIRQRMQWLQGAGFDFLSSESGFSEFTHPDDVLMLSWINITAAATDDCNMTSYIKCHCSSGQYCEHYKDPDTGEPLNFNYLPELADARMGLMPHTVQFYNFSDPANTYGNPNFTDMFHFLTRNIGRDQEVVYHGETTYWVNYDINVPLFLPIYALGRISDYRAIAREEDKKNKRIDGQMVFDSGWEWGYWLQDVLVARASWDPCTECESDEAAFAKLLAPVVKLMGAKVTNGLLDTLTKLVTDQRQLLTLGHYNASAPTPVSDAGYSKLNGMAYLAGWDAVSELAALAAPGDATQPNKLQFDAVRVPFKGNPDYWTQVRPILDAMNSTFEAHHSALAALLPDVSAAGDPLLRDIVDASEMLWLRARLVLALYDFAASWNRPDKSKEWRESRVADANVTMTAAVNTVARREAAYRVPVERVAGWRNGSTAYRFGYLWTAHSLYFWWRDYAKALITSPETLSPCFRNIQNPIDVLVGQGVLNNATERIAEWLERHLPGLDFIVDCIEPPIEEPKYGF